MALTTRQRVLLRFLSKQANYEIGRTTLMKWLFLYSQAQVTSVSRYDFVPYKYGPFSFEAFRDMQYTLARFIELGEDSVQLRRDCVAEAMEQGLRIPKRECQTVEEIWLNYHHLNQEALLDFVYSKFPWYASRSERVKSSLDLPIAKPAVYSVGYEGRSIDAFFTLLLSSGIQEILDVRRNAYSHKYGFLSHSLTRISSQLHIVYTHIPELGIASEFRKDLDEPGAHKRLFDQYDEDLKSKPDFLENAARILRLRSTALLCFEAEPHLCHRSRLAVHLSAMTGLPISHL